MPRVQLTPPAGVIGDNTSYADQGNWLTADKMRFREGRAQTANGWERITFTTLTGVCRNILQWTGTTIGAPAQYAFGTHLALQVYVGGGLYDITPTGLTPGSIDGTGGAGYGTGTYSTGAYSQPSTADYFPRTWSLQAYGGDLIASYRNGPIYRWQQDTTQKAALLANSPTQNTVVLVPNQRQVVALGTMTTDATPVFDPLLIRWSDINGGITTWAPATNNNAGFVRLTGAGRIVGAAMCGDNILVWTNAALYLGTYTGNTGALWTFERQGEHGGLIGPNAAAVIGQAAFWLSPSGQFYSYTLGNPPQVLACPVRDDFVNNIASVQQDKIVASTNSKFGEVWWFYPDGRDNMGSNLENSRAVLANVTEPDPTTGALPWSRALLARTAFTDADPSSFPIGADVNGATYFHEKGQSADGGVISFSIDTADQVLDPSSDQLLMVRGFWPDFQNQVGAVSVYIYSRLYPQSPEVTHGPYVCAPGRSKIDLRLNARMARVRFQSSASPSYFRMGSPAFDVMGAGTR